MASLVLLDGDLPGLVALATATERVSLDASDAAPAAMFDPSCEGEPSRVAAAKAQAARFGVELVRAPTLASGATPGERRTQALVLAGGVARGLNLTAVLWPIWVGRLDAQKDRAEQVATELDRVELVTRLLGLDANVAIEAPYVDLDHVPLADLAVDMDVPATETWWGSHAGDLVGAGGASAERDAWIPALEQAGWRGRLEPVHG